ncbi:MAG: hypothetical protein AAF415_04445 [Pseudomonadota bacterium]
MRILAVLAVCLVSSPALADWQLRQSDGFAEVQFSQDDYNLVMWCDPRHGLQMTLQNTKLTSAGFEGVSSLVLWLTLPDGRTDRWPVDVTPEGPALSGRFTVSDFNLGFYKDGQNFQLDSPQTGKIFLKGGMKGTGAARLAFQEQCGI